MGWSGQSVRHGQLEQVRISSECGRSWDMGLPVRGVEGHVRCGVLVHPDSKSEPSFGIYV